MLNRLIAFIQREKLYTSLFVSLIAIYAFAYGASSRHKKQDEKKEVITRFEKAEESFQKKISNPESLKVFLAENPGSAQIMKISVFFVAAVLVGGVIILFLFLTQRGWIDSWRINPESDFTPWSFRMFLRLTVLFLMFNMIFTLIMGGIKFLFFRELSENFFILSHTLLTSIAIAVFICKFVRQAGGKLEALGLRIPSRNVWMEILAGWVGYLAVVPLFAIALMLVVLFSNILGVNSDPHPLVYMFLDDSESSSLIGYSLTMAIFAAPVMEELFFRGFCYPIFKKYFGRSVGMVLTSSIFAAIHGSLFAFWPIFVLGLALNYLYDLRQSLVAPVTLHITHNAIFICFFFLSKHLILQS